MSPPSTAAGHRTQRDVEDIEVMSTYIGAGVPVRLESRRDSCSRKHASPCNHSRGNKPRTSIVFKQSIDGKRSARFHCGVEGKRPQSAMTTASEVVRLASHPARLLPREARERPTGVIMQKLGGREGLCANTRAAAGNKV